MKKSYTDIFNVFENGKLLVILLALNLILMFVSAFVLPLIMLPTIIVLILTFFYLIIILTENFTISALNNYPS